ncbi:MAG: biopolymer transporter ExbD [Cyanobacteria bacterium SBLK]|nr:biopolymer transporter ExbD [Cyanobacteria bacterium SBLK]
MNFRTQKYNSPIPRLDLIPLLNVMMVVLAFFILIALSLGTPSKTVEVQLPKGEAGGEIVGEVNENSQIVYLNARGQFLFQEQTFAETEIQEPIALYLEENSQNIAFLVPNPDVPYERVMGVLTQMQDIYGDRIALGLFAH